MSHPFGDLVSQYLHRKHGLSQSKLAAGVIQEPAVITRMCKGERLTGPQARERVVAIIGWLHKQGALETIGEANALLNAAGLAPLYEAAPPEAALLRQLRQPTSTEPSMRMAFSSNARTASLPVMSTPFIGRADDLATIQQHLADARCRMLTLAGPGGVGKTRLAVEAASLRTQAQAYANGVHFVNLQPVAKADDLPVAIADALRVALPSSDAPEQQLQRYLANKHVLLVLDNFEHLSAGATMLADLLTAAPQVQTLITSREILNLREEWQYCVEGVEVPPARLTGDVDDLLRYDAVRLFVECAHRVQPAFSLHRDCAAVARICQLTEGLPLAIELAAAWTKTLTCADIAHELERGLAILTSKLRNAPPRHSSMQAVFDHSWRLLSEQERAAFARLTIFRGGFAREAAMQVVGATQATLSSLVDKSFLRCTPDGRYHVHELLRQYGDERLTESADDLAQALEWHGRYYAAFLGDTAKSHIPEQQSAALHTIREEMDNLRAAWRWSVQQCHLDSIGRLAMPVYWIAQYGSSYLEGANALASAATRLQQMPETAEVAVALVEMLPYLSWLQLRLGRLEQAETSSNQCLSLQDKYGVLPQPHWGNGCLAILSIIAAIRGDYAEAERLAQKERALIRANDRWLNMPVACYAFANAAMAQGRDDEARDAISEAIRLCRQFGERWFLAYCLTTLGSIEFKQGNLQAAGAQYQAAYELREKFDDAEGMAVALNKLGEIALVTGDNDAARQRFEHSLDLYRDLNDSGGLATVLKGLGDVACAEGQPKQAALHYAQALRIAQDMNYVSLIFSLLLATGGLFLRMGRRSDSAILLMVVLHHPRSDEQCRSGTRQLLSQYGMAYQEAQKVSEADWKTTLDASCASAVRQLLAISD
jgi:predicted ATPase/predicted negative regulator of RcsB-dependent stress response